MTRGPVLASGSTRVSSTAHQAIRDGEGRTIGFELFFRDAGATQALDRTASATLRVLADHTASPDGSEHLYFVNVTREFLLGSLSLPTPTQIAVLEVQPDVVADPPVVSGAEQLRDRGFGIALDRYRPGLSSHHERLLSVASHVKIDLDETDDVTLQRTVAFVRDHSNARLVGTKIGSDERYQLATRLGCDLFQGWAIDEVHRDTSKRLLGSLANYIKLLELLAIDDDVIDMDDVAAAVMQDPGLSMRVLRACNNAAIGLPQPLESVQQAVTMVGVRLLRREVHFGIAQGLALDSDDRLHGLVEYARFADLVGQHIGLANGSGFLIGLLVNVAELCELSIDELLGTVNLAAHLVDGLRRQVGASGLTLLVVGHYLRTDSIPDDLPVSLTLDDVRELYVKATLEAMDLVWSLDRKGRRGSALLTLPEVWTGDLRNDGQTTSRTAAPDRRGPSVRMRSGLHARSVVDKRPGHWQGAGPARRSLTVIPESAGALLALLFLVSPGLLAEELRERHSPERKQSTFRELSRIALTSVGFNGVALIVFVLVRVTAPDLTVDVGAWLVDGDAYLDAEYHLVFGTALAWWLGVLLLVVVVHSFAWHTPITRSDSSAWHEAVRMDRPEGSVVWMQVGMADGRSFYGFYSAVEPAENGRYTIVLKGPGLAARRPATDDAPEPDASDLPAWDRVVVPADEVRFVLMTYQDRA